MKVNKVFAVLAVLITCLTYSFAQELSTPAATEQTSNYRGDSTTIAHNIHRASEIIGLNVTTPNKEDTIGEVNDLVIDSDSGMVRYAAVSVGGFLGIADKLVAVPWKSFRHEKDADGNTYLTLDTTKEKLEKAPGFDQDNWPDFGNPQWSTDNDRHYGVSVNVNR
jgi:sporulation protein YlmC with PRC-barrel domain